MIALKRHLQYRPIIIPHGFENRFTIFLINWDSLHAGLNSPYKEWSYNKKKDKEIKAYRKSL